MLNQYLAVHFSRGIKEILRPTILKSDRLELYTGVAEESFRDDEGLCDV